MGQLTTTWSLHGATHYDLEPAWDRVLRPGAYMGVHDIVTTWGLHGTMCCDVGPT